MKKILCFVGFALLFSGCGRTEENAIPDANSPSPLLRNIAKLRTAEQKKTEARTVGLSLEKAEITNGNLTFEIWLDNPDAKPIASVRSFLAFDPKALRGASVEIPVNSPFQIVAPEEKEFDGIRGLLKLGLAAEIPHRGKSVLLARVTMKRLVPQFTTIDFFDPGADGHTVVLERLADKTLSNVLKLPPVPGLVIPSQQ